MPRTFLKTTFAPRDQIARGAEALIALLALAIVGEAATQNTVPGAARERIRAAMGSNIETFSILGSDRLVFHWTGRGVLDDPADAAVGYPASRIPPTTELNISSIDTLVAEGYPQNWIKTKPGEGWFSVPRH